MSSMADLGGLAGAAWLDTVSDSARLPRTLLSRFFETGSPPPDRASVERVADVRRRVAVDEQQVGAESFGDPAPVAEPEAAGRGRCRGAQRLCGSQSGRHEVLQFLVQAGSV